MKQLLYICLFLTGVAHASGDRDESQNVDIDIDGTLEVQTPVEVQVPVEIHTPVTVETPEIHVDGTEVNPSLSVDSPVTVDAPVAVNNINNTRIPKQVPNAYFNYTPNFINCGRVIGFQFGNSSGVGSAGIPWFRDRTCDIWLAVNEAQENGHVMLSYAFMCEIKNIKNIWGLERCQEVTTAALAEWQDILPPPPPSPAMQQETDEEVARLHARIDQLTAAIEKQNQDAQQDVQKIERLVVRTEQQFIDDSEARRERALEELKKGGLVPEENK